MFDQGHNQLPVLEHELQVVMQSVVDSGGQFYQVRSAVREVAKDYPQYIIWSPELRGDQAVADVWSRSWERLLEVRVPVSKQILEAPMW